MPTGVGEYFTVEYSRPQASIPTKLISFDIIQLPRTGNGLYPLADIQRDIKARLSRANFDVYDVKVTTVGSANGWELKMQSTLDLWAAAENGEASHRR